ncbi:MAG: hypothetical protein QY325_04770 [Flavobacteriales bacterium]|nr:MAG: hypothetical protein QY325_04770 [Flavobacteriales bacterium]
MVRSCLAAAFTISAIQSCAQPRANIAGPDQFICGTATSMNAQPLAALETGQWSVLQGSAQFSDIGSPATPVTGLSLGENILRWTVLSPTGTETDLVSIWCYSSAMPSADAGPDQTVPPWPGAVQLNGSTPVAPATCLWTLVSGSGIFSDPSDPQATFSAPAIGTNVLQWSCDNGPCGQSSDAVVIEGVVGIDDANAPMAAIRYDAQQHALVITGAREAMDLVIHDAQGREVRSVRTPAGAGLWKLDDLPDGVYVASASTNVRRITLRFAATH